MENNTNNNNPTPMPLSSALQAKLQLINVRVNDLMLALNDVVTVLLRENQQLRSEVEHQKSASATTPVIVEPTSATQQRP
ncbi:hypothetical protein [Candidatus Bathycorpusculum sp.]|uniref:hypothetical protein n=1 Tax=Candidatus Bathycorpusculum sp. TaxID=2994959 RepID=UPI0028378113|nr:hypothetical protein [Candidatus Termitimicrobium sp.]MCL2432843.1 hypothetical protein [Candidatus Termitimicrobium sp.]